MNIPSIEERLGVARRQILLGRMAISDILEHFSGTSDSMLLAAAYEAIENAERELSLIAKNGGAAINAEIPATRRAKAGAR